MLYVVLISTMTKSNLRGIIFYLMEDHILSSTSKSSSIIEGSQDRDSGRKVKAETENKAMKE